MKATPWRELEDRGKQCCFVSGTNVLVIQSNIKVDVAVRGFLVGLKVKNPPAMWETWVRSRGQEEPLEKEMATHSNILREFHGQRSLAG